MNYAITKLKEISVSDLPQTGTIFVVDFPEHDHPLPDHTHPAPPPVTSPPSTGSQELGDRPIYNAITDGNIIPDYQNQINYGTDQRKTVVDWIQPGLLAGKERFFFPPGHYQIGEGAGNSSTVISIDGYDSIEIFGIKGRTFFHSKQWTDLKYKNNPFFRFGWQEESKYCKVHGITFVNDNHVTNSEQSDSDNGVAWGWCYIKEWKPKEKIKTGDFRRSVSDDSVIEYLEDGITGENQLILGTGPLTESNMSITLHGLSDWKPNWTYEEGSFAKFVDPKNLYNNIRSVARCMKNGISGINEPTLSRPSNDGAKGSNQWSWISLNNRSRDIEVYDCEFVGCAGFSEAGGTAIGITGRDHYIHHNIFRDFQYGTALGGYFRNCKILYNKFKKCGGWGYQYGTFNAHGVYCQGGGNLFAFNEFDSHYYGLDIKIHGNVPNSDCWNNRFIGNTHKNFGWTAVELVKSVAYNGDGEGSDFIDESESGTFHTSILCKQALIEGCTFEIQKSVWDNWNDWGNKPGASQAIKSSLPGMLVTNCTFKDTHGITSGDYPVMNWGDLTPSITISNCSFQHIFRFCTPFIGESLNVNNCDIDLRAVKVPDNSRGIYIKDFCKLSDIRIYARKGPDAGGVGYGVLTVNGDHISLDNVTVSLDEEGCVFSPNGGNYVSIKNCKFIAPNGRLAWRPDSAKFWEFENNFWQVGHDWKYGRFDKDALTTWRWRNEKGNLWNSNSTNTEDRDLMDFDNGTVKFIKADTRYFETLILVDAQGRPSGDDIYGVALWNDAYKDSNDKYKRVVATSVGSYQWIRTKDTVSIDDWVTSSLDGKVETSVIRPASGFIGIVRDVKGTTAQIEIIRWD